MRRVRFFWPTGGDRNGIENNEAALPDEGGEQGGRSATKKEMSLMDLTYPLNSSRPFKKRWIVMMKAQETKGSSDSHSEDW